MHFLSRLYHCDTGDGQAGVRLSSFHQCSKMGSEQHGGGRAALCLRRCCPWAFIRCLVLERSGRRVAPLAWKLLRKLVPEIIYFNFQEINFKIIENEVKSECCGPFCPVGLKAAEEMPGE